MKRIIMMIIAASALTMATRNSPATAQPLASESPAPSATAAPSACPAGMAGRISAQVREIFAKYPNGGPEMVAALKTLLAGDHVCKCPELAREIVAAARKASLDQKIAVGQALADAQVALAADEKSAPCAKLLKDAAASADPQTLAVYNTGLENATASENSAKGGAEGLGHGAGGAGATGGGLSSASAAGGSVSPN